MKSKKLFAIAIAAPASSTADAGPKEEYCIWLGDFAKAIAEIRDEGIKQNIVAVRLMQSNIAGKRFILDVVKAIYTVPLLTPEEIQKETLLACLQTRSMQM